MVRKLRVFIVDIRSGVVRSVDTKFELQTARISAIYWKGHRIKVTANWIVCHFGEVGRKPLGPIEKIAIDINVVVSLIKRDAVIIKRSIGEMQHKCDRCLLLQNIAQRGVVVSHQWQDLIAAGYNELAILVSADAINGCRFPAAIGSELVSVHQADRCGGHSGGKGVYRN